MTEQCVTTLPPTSSSASAARRLVEAAIGDGGLQIVLDEALLLVTELVTNAVVHAGTDIELQIETSADEIRVEVIDKTPGLLNVGRHINEDAREGGRGLLLVEALADEWGTRHFGWGKSVWFVLGQKTERRQAIRLAEPHDPPHEPARQPRRDIGWLTELRGDLEQTVSPDYFVTELLHRLAEGLGLDQCWVYAHSSDDEQRWELVARHDPLSPAPDADAVRRATRRSKKELADTGILLLPLQGASGVFGALAIGAAAKLGRAESALARLVGERIGVAVRDDRARTTQLRSRGFLALLAEASEMFAGTLDVQLAMTLATQLVVPRFARWSAVWATYERAPRLMAIAHADEERLGAMQSALSGADGDELASRLARDLSERRPNLLPGSALPTELVGERNGEVLALPLVARRRLLGVLVIGRPPGAIFGADDVGLLNDLARRTAVAVDSARLYEESTMIARALQASLLPPTLPRGGVAEFGARYAPAGEGNEVGGDFYDVFELSDGGWGIAIGDVCGKGPEAAAITGMARDVLRLLMRDGARPPAALRRLNEAILDLGERGRFCTAMLGTIRPDADRLRVTLSCAGHPRPVLLRANGEVGFAGPHGTLLGVLDHVELSEETVILEAGDALVFYTDGVTERRNGSAMFGEHNLLDCLRTVAGQSADTIAEWLEEQVRRFGAARDDLAVLVVRATGEQVAGDRVADDRATDDRADAPPDAIDA